MTARVLLLICAAVLPAAGQAAGTLPQRGVTPAARPSPATAPAGRYYALVIGIDRYDRLPHLATAVHDATAIAATLHDSYGFETVLLLDAAATRNKILEAVNQYRRNLRPEDNLLIYYAGHGQFDKDADRAYWLPVDAEPDSSANWIIADDLTADARALPARHVLIVSDSCYSGGLTRDAGAQIRSSARDLYLQKMLGARSRTLMASGGNEPVADAGRSGHSVFANAFLEGLVKTPDPSFTAEQLFFRFVREPVAGASAQVPQYNILRNSGHEDGDFVFFRHEASAAGTATKASPPESPARVQPAASGSGAPASAVASEVSPKDGLTYVWIPPGKFSMGCSPGDQQCLADEIPAHEVEITRGFWLAQTDVTVGAWKRYRADTGTPPLGAADVLGRTNLNEAGGDDRMPVVLVSWDRAAAFCAWSGGVLPTEAQWEYAARAGETGPRYGDLDAIAWHADNSGLRPIDSGELARTDPATYRKKLFENGDAPHRAGQKQPNAWSLYDMLGNVNQWTADWYNQQYFAKRAGQDPSGPAEGQGRVIRGGSFSDRPGLVRLSSRGGAAPDGRVTNLGFRCVVSPTAPTTRVNPKDGLTYVWIPAGKFTMGCSPGDKQCRDEEIPAHPVTITHGFWIGQTHVTVGAWKRYRAGAGKPPLATQDALGRTNLNEASGDDAMPAVAPNWDEAAAFCAWSGGYLPSEAQWEYAARAGETGARYGDLDAIAWHAENAGLHPIDSVEIERTDPANYRKRLFENGNGPHRVGQKQPNAWGLYDMLGNVMQWTSDWWDARYYLQKVELDPTGPSPSNGHVVRGGSFAHAPALVRLSSRAGATPENRTTNVGLRCAAN